MGKRRTSMEAEYPAEALDPVSEKGRMRGHSKPITHRRYDHPIARSRAQVMEYPSGLAKSQFASCIYSSPSPRRRLLSFLPILRCRLDNGRTFFSSFCCSNRSPWPTYRPTQVPPIPCPPFRHIPLRPASPQAPRSPTLAPISTPIARRTRRLWDTSRTSGGQRYVGVVQMPSWAG